MIQRIYIKDYVLIEELSLDLGQGFLAITGETGAGKSILIGAIGLVLGGRADNRAVREGAAKAIVELTCATHDREDLRTLFEDNDLDFAEVCTFRREVTSAGKSRAFINDTPVTMALMKELGGYLVDIHSQHHNMLIGETTYQMAVVDMLAESQGVLGEYKAAYTEYKEAKKKLEDERERIERQSRDIDYIKYQYKELKKADIEPNELEEIEERLSLAHSAQDVEEALGGLMALSERDDDNSPLDEISRVIRYLDSVSDSYAPAEEMVERLESIRIELSDLVSQASDLMDGLWEDSDDIPSLEKRFNQLQSLLYKHHLKTTQELIDLRDDYHRQLSEVNDAEGHLLALEKAVETAFEKASGLAQALSEKRQTASGSLLPQLDALIRELGIAGATFAIDLTPTELSSSGADKVAFLLATNKQTALRPIKDIASGGEISRFMLALKSILAARSVLPTVIYDEIDTGVSGEVASKIGQLMMSLGKNIQVITITHLPQIAALADHQYVVSKHEGETTYVTNIAEVSGEARVQEIAGMLSGADITAAAIENAKALLQNSKQ